MDRALARRSVRRRDQRFTPPRYEAVVEEGALRRATAPALVLRRQLEHLLQLMEMPNVSSVRVLLLDHPVSNFFVPHSSFGMYRFADPDDPTLVVLETVTRDVEIRDKDEITCCARLNGRRSRPVVTGLWGRVG
ncbi:Scr1 family TA system antitoxin-like transcriptional regulator [Actinocatenispora sera]|uniref:Scr1 family TA system antitoxin-like transcriptional regulator n=1 Tax=Actinocatenispora sera TaxID=390989 RepID=UPI0034102F13